MSPLNLNMSMIEEAMRIAKASAVKPKMIRGKPYYVIWKPNPLWFRLRNVSKRMRPCETKS
jgi:hypothetical protein